MRLGIGLFCSSSMAALALTAQPLPAQEAPEATSTSQIDEIVVTGFRRSIATSQSIKRYSDRIVDAIVAEDIGKLPDITASASLARVTGVQVSRAAGEASQVRIRGLPDLRTTYNGRDIYTAEGRSVAIQDFPAASVARLEVYKSSSADLIESGIAGLINVVSRRPFDFKGLKVAGSLNGVYFEQAPDVAWNGNLLFSNRWDTGIGEMGLLLNANIAYTDYLDSTREQALFIEYGVPVAPGSDTYRRATRAERDRPDVIRYPDNQAIFYAEGERWRPSTNVAFQWVPTPDLELYADALFQGFRGRDGDHFLFVPLFGGGLSLGDVVLQPGTNQAQSFTATGGRRPDGFNQSFHANTDTYQFGGGAIYDIGRLRLSTDLAYTDSTFELEQANVDFAFASTPVRDVVFDSPGDDGGPIFSFRDFDLADPDNFVFRGLFERARLAEGDGIQARIDAEYGIEEGVLQTVQTGVRFSDRDASQRTGRRFQNVESQGILYSQLPVDLHMLDSGFAFGGTGGGMLPQSWLGPTRDSIRGNLSQLRALVGFPDEPVPYDDLRTFVANEKSYTAYAQIGYAFDVGFPIDGLIGLRAVRTDGTISGTSRVQTPNPGGPGNIVTFEPVTRANEYTDYLPNVSARLEFLPDLQLRLAYTQSRTRPSFGQLNPSLNFRAPPAACDPDSPPVPGEPPPGPDNPNCRRRASGGNPDLRPIESNNYDLSLEYYFSRTGAATIALFRRDVNGFISRFEQEVMDPDLGRLSINRPANGEDGRLQGIELVFGTFFDFDFLPDRARNFGFRANYTYIDGEAELPTEGLGQFLPGMQAIPGVSEHTYNLVAMYEVPEFSARLAYNHRSEFVDFYRRDGEEVFPIIENGRGTLDFAATVTPMRELTIAFNVSNILGDPITRDRIYDESGAFFRRQVKYLERVWSLGARFRFF